MRRIPLASEGNGESFISVLEYSLLMIVTGMAPILLRAGGPLGSPPPSSRSYSPQLSCREEQRSASSAALRAESLHWWQSFETESVPLTVFVALVPLVIAVAFLLVELISGNP